MTSSDRMLIAFANNLHSENIGPNLYHSTTQEDKKCPDMTKKLLTGTESISTNKKIKMFDTLKFCLKDFFEKRNFVFYIT